MGERPQIRRERAREGKTGREREKRGREGETEDCGGSNKDEGVQLADSGQSTRTPTTE